jgi:hypothetical protein
MNLFLIITGRHEGVYLARALSVIGSGGQPWRSNYDRCALRLSFRKQRIISIGIYYGRLTRKKTRMAEYIRNAIVARHAGRPHFGGAEANNTK